MAGDSLQSRADVFAARIEAFAAALRASGVSADTSERLLSQASAASLQALTLELLLAEADRRQTSGLAPHPETGDPRGPGFRLAA